MNKKELFDELREEGIKEEIIKVMNLVDRKNFVPLSLRDRTYENIPLSLGPCQTISQPYTVGFMLQQLELKKGNKVLEIGTGSGWNAALISNLVGKKGRVYTMEVVKKLAEESKNKLAKYRNIQVIFGGGYKGLEKYASYDRIIFTAAPNRISNETKKQLKVGGILLVPIGIGEQRLIKIKRTEKGFVEEDLGAFVFVPMIEK